MAVAAPKRNSAGTSLQVRNTEPLGSTDTPGINDARARSMIQTLREMLAKQGVFESHSGEQEGFYFVIEDRGEMSLQYNDIEEEGLSTCAATPLRRNEVGLLKCCHELAQRGYALTLVMSPRTLVLHIRCD